MKDPQDVDRERVAQGLGAEGVLSGDEVNRLRRMARRMARTFGGGLGYMPKPSKVYADAVAGSRAAGRGASEPGWLERWIAGDVPERGLFRKRRDALAECKAGNDDAQPRLVLVSPGPFRQVFPAGTPKALAAAAVQAYDEAHTYDLEKVA